MSRKRGRIVLVGVSGLKLNRADFYEKELSFQVSCSYGPGRYDPAYEEGGQDYPVGFVRWTEQRNFEAVLDLMASGAIKVQPLISHRFAIDEGQQAMALLASGEPSLGIMIAYPQTGEPAEPARRVALRPVGSGMRAAAQAPSVGFLGAGNYAGRVLIPAFKAAGANMQTVASSGGVSAVHFGRRFDLAEAATDETDVISAAEVDAVVIGTRHDAHARQVLAAIAAGKHVFCEKPLCLTLPELDAIEAAAADAPELVLMVGYNRRFAPHVERMRALLASVDQPKSFLVTVNAGAIPADHWTQDAATGGGRIIGEACHFVDLVQFLANSPITGFTAAAIGEHPAVPVRDDKATINLAFADGSMASIHYLANGHKGFPKERVEVFAAGRVLQLDNFIRLTGWGWPGFSKLRLWKQDKGQLQCVKAFVDALRDGTAAPIARDDLFATTRASIMIAESLR
jgi:predicted dehydrogenase